MHALQIDRQCGAATLCPHPECWTQGNVYILREARRSRRWGVTACPYLALVTVRAKGDEWLAESSESLSRFPRLFVPQEVTP